MGMDMARDIRASNLASAERKERSKYRKKADKRADRAEDRADSAEDRAESAEKRAKRKSKRDKKESDLRTKSLKRGMRDAKDEKKHKKELRSSEITKANAEAKLAQAKAENATNPLIGVFKEKAALLDHYKKTVGAAGARHASEIGPILNRINELQTPREVRNPDTGKIENFARSDTPELLDLMAVRDSMVNTHKDFLAGLEQAFMASSNQPHTGQVSIVPYTSTLTGQTAYNFKLDGASPEEAKAFYEHVKSMGVNTGNSASVFSAQPPAITNPSDPADLGIRNP